MKNVTAAWVCVSVRYQDVKERFCHVQHAMRGSNAMPILNLWKLSGKREFLGGKGTLHTCIHGEKEKSERIWINIFFNLWEKNEKTKEPAK